MASDPDRPKKLAVLIDAENASHRIATGLFEEIATIGEASVRRIYGDFSGPQLKGWESRLSTHAIIPQQNYATVAGKNASDIALVIDAMDLLHSGRFDGFCLVTSDSDFTRLAARIREQGVDVYGFGEQKTPKSFRQACKRFIYTENLCPPEAVAEVAAASAKPVEKPGAAPAKLPPTKAIPLIRTALGQLDDADGWYSLSSVGARLNMLSPDFDSRTFGCTKLVTLIEKAGMFEIKRDPLRVSIRLKP
ncbi:NYN domain-containing protein [Novosphingobium sp. 9]|uniref:NYN domain-containing protein n=1 Tax=Novosphingobium sp. 9 TaxID=2025349 RepID=UPI0021B5EFAF|nr:NYN domain-containing protein [Novosphingobium sp. 9]